MLLTRRARALAVMGERPTSSSGMVYRHTWLVLASGFFEPLFYLLSIGIGIGELVGKVSFDGHPVSYTSFVAPALLATSAMNCATLRLDVQHLLPAQVRQALRRGAGDTHALR